MSAKVFVGGLNFKTSEAELDELFRQAGSVQSVSIPTERETGRSRGFAFVEFSSDAEAATAIEQFNGFEFAGRQLRVNAAEEKPQRSRSFAGNGGGGGGGNRPDFGPPPGGDRFGGGRPKGSRRNVRAKKRSL